MRIIRIPFTVGDRTHWVSVDPADVVRKPVQRAPLVGRTGRTYRYVTLLFTCCPHLTATVIDPKDTDHATV
jgi:hypothetical protein